MDFYFICFISLACACFCLWISNRVIPLEYFLSVVLIVVTLFTVLCSVSISDLEVLESRSDASASLLARNASKIQQGKKPYATYLPTEDYETIQQHMD